MVPRITSGLRDDGPSSWFLLQMASTLLRRSSASSGFSGAAPLCFLSSVRRFFPSVPRRPDRSSVSLECSVVAAMLPSFCRRCGELMSAEEDRSCQHLAERLCSGAAGCELRKPLNNMVIREKANVPLAPIWSRGYANDALMLPPESAKRLDISSSTTPIPSNTKCLVTSLCATTTPLLAEALEDEAPVTAPAAQSGIRGATMTGGTGIMAVTGGGTTIAASGTTDTPTESGGTSVGATTGAGAVTAAIPETRETVTGIGVVETGTVAAGDGAGATALGPGSGRSTAALSRRDAGDVRRSVHAVSCIPKTDGRSSRKVSCDFSPRKLTFSPARRGRGAGGRACRGDG